MTLGDRQWTVLTILVDRLLWVDAPDPKWQYLSRSQTRVTLDTLVKRGLAARVPPSDAFAHAIYVSTPTGRAKIAAHREAA